MEHLRAYLFSGIITVVLLLVIMGTFLADKDSRFAKWFGMNLKQTYCPNCKQKVPIIRKPANAEQALFNRCTCITYCF